MSRQDQMNTHSSAWLNYVKLSFLVSVVAMGIGIWIAPVDLWVKGYLMMGQLFMVGSTITMTKTIRDEFESGKIVNLIKDAKHQKILKEYGGES